MSSFRRGGPRRSAWCLYLQPQCSGAAHTASGKRGASAARKRLAINPRAASQQYRSVVIDTACHGPGLAAPPPMRACESEFEFLFHIFRSSRIPLYHKNRLQNTLDVSDAMPGRCGSWREKCGGGRKCRFSKRLASSAKGMKSKPSTRRFGPPWVVLWVPSDREKLPRPTEIPERLPHCGADSRKGRDMSDEKHINELIDQARELVSTLRNTKNPDIQRLRDRVNAFISDAKRRKSNRREGAVKVTRIPGSVFDYVHDHPFLAVLTAASLAWTLSHLSSAARDRLPRG